MATRLVHLSDLHLPPRDAGQLESLTRVITEASPDLIVVSGDITRRGARAEFGAGREFLAGLPGKKLVVPGNHDIPTFDIAQRLLSPFDRFEDAFGSSETPVFENDDLLLIGLNTAYGTRFSADWSLGYAAPEKIAAVENIIRTRKETKLTLVTCHHPLLANALDPHRSRTSGGRQAFAKLAEAGMDILLHGHLHRHASECLGYGQREVCQIGANTALSDRERDGASGFNLLDIQDGACRLSSLVWRDREYVSNSVREYCAKPIGIPMAGS